MTDEQYIYVSPGDVIVLKNNGLLVSTPLGSCIAVIAYDTTTQIGGMAHVMLPGSCSDCKTCRNTNKYRYAEEAIFYLFKKLYARGVKKRNVKICLVGGSNVLRKYDDSLVDAIINSVYEVLMKRKITVAEAALRGHERRNALLDIATGNLYYSVGDGESKVLCRM